MTVFANRKDQEQEIVVCMCSDLCSKQGTDLLTHSAKVFGGGDGGCYMGITVLHHLYICSPYSWPPSECY